VQLPEREVSQKPIADDAALREGDDFNLSGGGSLDKSAYLLQILLLVAWGVLKLHGAYPDILHGAPLGNNTCHSTRIALHGINKSECRGTPRRAPNERKFEAT
jgi:hypothetical protein